MSMIIAGSGPSAVSAAYALLRKGLSVTMLDIGYRLEPERQELVDRLASAGPPDWDPSSLVDLRRETSANVKGLPTKLVYGSDYPYRIPEHLVRYELRGAKLAISHALGGLSNTWGANVLPFLDEDLEDWPIGTADLALYYRTVFSFVDLAAHDDGLSRRFPLYSDTARPFRPSRQAEALMQDLEARRDTMARLGFEFGYSRLAVRAQARNGDTGCVYCGLCLYGCPYRLIYSSAHTLPALQEFAKFRYVPGYYVERVEEFASGVIVHARRVEGGAADAFPADRAFLGCGTISTTKIVLESLGAVGREVLVCDNQYFLTPLIRFRGVQGVRDEALHTLSQVCLELIDSAVSERSVHLLVYTYNDLYRRALDRLAGPLAGPFRSIGDRLLSHTLIILGYLHSHDSPRVALRLERDGSRVPARVVLEGRPNPAHRVCHSQGPAPAPRGHGALRAVVVPGMTQVGAPGSSYHLGASLPMRRSPGDLECDLVGRPHGFRTRPRGRSRMLPLGSGDQRDPDCHGQCVPDRRSRT